MTPGRLTEHFLSLAKTYDQRVALTDGSGRVVTYSELAQRVEQFSAHLRVKGLMHGGRVAMLQSKSIESVIVILSILECNATYIPVDPSMSANRIQFLLRDADPDILVAEPILVPTEIPCQLEICERVDGMEKTSLTIFTRNEGRENNLAYILYTSGSTGTPKGVCVSHSAARAFVYWSRETFQLQPGDKVASIAPFHFDLSVFDLYSSLLSGCTLHLFNSDEVKNSRLIAQEISKRNITCIYATPSFYTTLLLYGKPEKYSWNSLKKVLFAGEVFPVKHLHELMQLWSSAHFFNLYGPTETNVCTWTEIHKNKNRTTPYPIGLPCTGHEFEISEAGELYVGGPNIADGYLNNDELTSERFFTRDGMRWFKTGDIVETDADGNLVFAGRIDRMIKRRGYRIEPAEIEKALMIHPAITNAAVADVRGKDELPLLAAFVTGENVPDIIGIKEFLLKYIPEYMLPDQVRVMEHIPLTTTGKADYVQLRKTVTEHQSKE